MERSEADRGADSRGDVTRLLERATEGDSSALDDLFPLVYGELRRIARGQRRRVAATDRNDTLNTTALVHEAYLRLVGWEDPAWRHRGHFYAVAAKAMRQILIDHARRQRAGKRGGDRKRVAFDEVERTLRAEDPLSPGAADAVLALEGALQRLEEESERHARIVELRFFAGMTIPDTAKSLGISPATVKRGWAVARSWLHRDLRERLT